MKQLMSIDIIATLTAKLDFYLQALDAYLSEANHLKMLSMVLMLLALVLFLSLMIIIYVRSIIYFVKNNNPAKRLESNLETDDEEDTADTDNDRQELERELQRELDLALAVQKAQEEQLEKAVQKQKREQSKSAKEEKKQEKKIEEPKEKSRDNSSPIGFDWQKGKIPPAEVESYTAMASLSYQQSQKELNQLIGLVIDMLGRGVDDLKIAQTLNFKTKGMTDENEILKSIDAIKQFINLCLSGKFTKLAQYENLPKENQALYHLANGDSSLALALMENLMDTEIDRANSCGIEEKRQRIYGEVSNYACCFGALAEINDLMLSTSAYELAIELQSVNVTAWGRLGDVCNRANSASKAAWAYQNVLNFADSEIDAAQIANANKHLSEQLYADGNSLQAAKLYNASKQYYDSLGINRRLDKQELEIINIIETNYKQSLSETIQKLLASGYQNS